MYNKDAIVVEPAGAISVAALELYQNKFLNQHVSLSYLWKQ